MISPVKSNEGQFRKNVPPNNECVFGTGLVLAALTEFSLTNNIRTIVLRVSALDFWVTCFGGLSNVITAVGLKLKA